jgi:hypothetical protein
MARNHQTDFRQLLAPPQAPATARREHLTGDRHGPGPIILSTMNHTNSRLPAGSARSDGLDTTATASAGTSAADDHGHGRIGVSIAKAGEDLPAVGRDGVAER